MSDAVRHRGWVAALAVLVLVLLLASLRLGDYAVGWGALADTLRGDPPDRITRFFVLERRLPRALVALVVGAGLATAGAVFQAVTRNPLASPDVIGVTSGASAGAVVVLLVLGGSATAASWGALAGALLVALLVGGLTVRSGLQGGRLILLGIAFGALASSVVAYLLTQVFVASAVTAQTWLTGTLQGRGWAELRPVALVLLVVLPVVLGHSSALRILELGDDVARSLGVRVDAVRGTLLALGTVLVAAAVATAGPISFVALVAPHVARLLTGTAAILPAALTGACLLAAADLVALYAFPVAVPVGVVTVTLGGIFFVLLLWREGRRSAAR
ncbi:FecCD family ABC transporter permease [Pimelobacter simplex]|uniref:FecCD family ABC transporter permease n=1 Tax=Nocardioides simplex TaxID=2045 RepID=UPI0038302B4F